VEITPRGPFDLAHTAAFVHGFVPLGAPQAGGGSVRLGLHDDETGDSLAFEATQSDGVVHVEYASDLPEERVREHVERILSLDIDASDWPDVGERDPVVGAAQRSRPGLRPVLFPTTFEAAVWALLSQRTSRTQAARIKAGLTIPLELPGGPPVPAFPAPADIEKIESIKGVPAPKIPRLQGIAAAARVGDLDPRDLRALDPDQALRDLCELPGVGPFSAMLILIRGAGHPDVVALAEPRFRQALGRAYGKPLEDDAEVVELAEAWRPYRSWVAFLLRSAL
jgi:3-methyladenine DNA glycosylase/8-oxoguanine DNA glycosylase